MPQSTPIYSFPYPCEGEDITVTAFANLANAIDSKLAELNTDSYEARNRYNFAAETAQNVLAAGVDTVLAGANSTYTIPADGVYFIKAKCFNYVDPATFTSLRVRVRKNAVVQFGARQNPESQMLDFLAAGMIPAAAGDTISFQALFTGTGSWTMSVIWYVAMFVRIQ